MSVLAHVVESISPASRAHAEAARQRVASAGVPMLERLAASLAAAQHTSRPRTRRTIVVCAADHAGGDPGIRLGASHPTVLAARAIADGSAALCGVARAVGAPIVLVDAGVVEAAEMPAVAIRLGDAGLVSLGSAMATAEVERELEAGIALAVSLVDGGVDVIAVGALGVGSELAAAALLGSAGPALADPEAEVARVRGAAFTGSPSELLAAFGGRETAVLAGLILAAASMNVPVILDGEATGAAALAAARFAPAVTGYLIAAHAGMRSITMSLGLEPVFEVGLGHGEGTGAAMVFPLIDQVAALAATTPA